MAIPTSHKPYDPLEGFGPTADFDRKQMATLDRRIAGNRQVAPFPLEVALDRLRSFGTPRMRLEGAAWDCEVSQNGKFANVTIQSDFDHPSAESAANQCIKRVDEYTASMRGAT